MTAWYLKKIDGSVYGPVEGAELREWAADGRVAPDDHLSEDQQNWQPAPELSDLDMVWLVDFGGGQTFGPINILAACDLIEDGSVPATTPATNQQTGETKPLQEALVDALLADRKTLLAARETQEVQWQAVLGKQQEIAQAREAELRHKLEETRKRQAALVESFKQIEQRLGAGAAAAPAKATPGSPQAEELQRKLQRAEQELGELKKELDKERRESREQIDEWKRRVDRRAEEKQELEQKLSESQIITLSADTREELAEVRKQFQEREQELMDRIQQLQEKKEQKETPAPKNHHVPDGIPTIVSEREQAQAAKTSSNPVVRGVASKLKIKAGSGKKGGGKSPPRLKRNGGKGISSSQIRRGPLRGS